jgi:acyl-CoA thioesterase-1
MSGGVEGCRGIKGAEEPAGRKSLKVAAYNEGMPHRFATLTLCLLIPTVLQSAGRAGAAAATRPAAAETAAPRLAAAAASASSPAAGAAARPAAAAPGATPARPAARGPLVAFLGDSLTAGLGLPADQSYPAQLELRMSAAGTPIRVLNAGVSGDTSAGGLRRLGWILARHPDVLVVGLGANDALRAQPLDEIEHNLRQIVSGARAAGARVVLLGMKIPPNYGPDYAGGFAAIYPRVARDLKVPLVPFLLEGVGGMAQLNQADGIHPTAEGQQRVAANVLPVLRSVVAGLPKGSG